MPPNQTWRAPDIFDTACIFAFAGATFSAPVLRLFRRARPGAWTFRFGALSMLAVGTLAITDPRTTREVLIKKDVQVSTSPGKLWARSNGFTTDDSAVLGGLSALALRIKVRPLRILPTWQRYVGYAGITLAGALLGSQFAAQPLLLRRSRSLKAQNDMYKAEQKKDDDMMQLRNSPDFLEKMDHIFLGKQILQTVSSIQFSLHRAGISDAALLSPLPRKSPVSWLPQSIYPILLHPGIDESRIDWTLAARLNPQPSGNTVDTMTREAEYVAFQINERIQALGLSSPGPKAGTDSERNPTLISSTMALIRLQRSILEDIEEEKSRHGEIFDVSAFLSSLNIEAKHNRNYDPQASVSCLRASLAYWDKGFESALAKGTVTVEQLQPVKTGLKLLINDLERESYAVQNLQYGGIEGSHEAPYP
ncbi:hypothetical protein PMIN01_10049 [Paraphaeosphaeria minitans]|uniref:Uncharacterized protein n=1 Tax=Paraphaeosphaeria minitans TaxID=565426 RepID=A0A9P6GBR3_9PLEO|nr:hypothetical protein PMIN01_10049 [Paraphaeosphaeria minitans]